MGQLIEQIAEENGDIIIAIAGTHENPLFQEDMILADVCIDFSHASLVLSHIELAIQLQKPLIIGTTGWHDQMAEAQKIVAQSPIGVLYAPNFSLGVYLFSKLVEEAADLFNAERYRDWETDRKSTRLNSSHSAKSRMPSSA